MEDYFLREAFKQAEIAYKQNEVPVGCVIVKDKEILVSTYNLKETTADCTAHAELIAIQKAQKILGDWRLNNCEIYVTLEPCPMCAGAILHARFKKVVYGAIDIKWGAETILGMFSEKKFNHIVQFQYLKNIECSKILSNFFKERRKSFIKKI